MKRGIVPESTVRALHRAKKRTFTVSLYRTLQVHLVKGYFEVVLMVWEVDVVRIYFIMEKELLHATLPKELQREVADSLTLSYRWCFGRSGDGIFPQRLLDACCKIHL